MIQKIRRTIVTRNDDAIAMSYVYRRRTDLDSLLPNFLKELRHERSPTEKLKQQITEKQSSMDFILKFIVVIALRLAKCRSISSYYYYYVCSRQCLGLLSIEPKSPCSTSVVWKTTRANVHRCKVIK